jgi:hypothetical protein
LSPSSSFTSSGPQSPQHSILARTTHDQRIKKWLEELINDTDLDEDDTDIPTPEEIASVMVKLDLGPDNGMDIKDALVPEDILMEVHFTVCQQWPGSAKQRVTQQETQQG